MNEKQAIESVRVYNESLKYYVHRWQESMLNRDSKLMECYAKEMTRIKGRIQMIKDKYPEYFL